jgi:hypothetical protein
MEGLRDHKVQVIEQLKKDELFREAYFNETLNEDVPAVVLSMLRDIVEATK